jgi:hypothetical protein
MGRVIICSLAPLKPLSWVGVTLTFQQELADRCDVPLAFGGRVFTNAAHEQSETLQAVL